MRHTNTNTKQIRRKMVVDMEVEQAKAAVLQLMTEKDKIERDLKDANAVLENVRIEIYSIQVKLLQITLL